MSPFEVSADDDVGYQATNTTSGSRLATSLRDTAASISPFTPEFLSDIAATGVNDMLNYATNAELNAGDSEGAGFNNPRDINSAGGEPFRIRGLPGAVSTDYVENAAPQDLYNIERAEVASGANSILFGSGDAGGLVSLATKKANVTRNRFSGQVAAGSWFYRRLTADLNQVLLPRVLALRVSTVYGDAQGWRQYDWNDTKRLFGALTYKPFKRTTISASGEDGLTRNSVGLRWNTSDQVTRWLAAGRPVSDAAANASQGTSSLGGNQRYTYYAQSGFVANMRNELRTTTAPQPADTLISPTLFPYDVNWAGPSPRLSRDFQNWQVSVEQRLFDSLTLQGLYLRNRTDSRARTFVYQSNTMDLFGDPNLTIPAPGGSGTVANPHAGKLYLETFQSGDSTLTENEVKRVTAAYELKLGRWFGNHRFAALWENAVQQRYNESHREILVDQFNRPVANVGAPENTQNLLYRRSYLDEGDLSTYALTGLYTPLAPFSYNTLTIAPRYVKTGELRAEKDVESLMFAAQSSWFGGRLATTLGYRRDDIIYLDTSSGRVTDPADPRLADGSRLLNEVTVLPGYNRKSFTADTLTVGGVWHAHKRLSLLANKSTNHGAPRFDRRILPDGRIPPTPEGENQEYGAMFDLLGDDRYFIRVNYFETAQIGDAAVSPSGAVTNATTLGRAQTLSILQALQAAGRITQAEYDAQAFNWNAAVIDTATHGYELELIANPTRQWTIRANYSHSTRGRENFFAEGRAYFARKFPEWRAQAAANPTLAATVDAQILSIEEEIEDRAAAQQQAFGSVPHKATLTTRYRFDAGPLKGAFLGGAVRYQGRAFAQADTRDPSAGGTGKNYYANGTLFVDPFVGYKFRMPGSRALATLQLNIRNLTNSYHVTIARWNSDFSGARRIYLRDPRSWRLSLSLDY